MNDIPLVRGCASALYHSIRAQIPEVSPEIECTLNRDECRVGLKLEFWSISSEFVVDEIT